MTQLMKDLKKIMITALAALVGGALFSLLHIPVPWLLGPMLVMVICKNVMKWNLTWPSELRDSGMIIVGYTIGLSMTSAALKEMAEQLPSMLLLTILLMLWCSGIAFLVSKVSKIDFQSALLGSIPGGLTQVIMLAEETKGINLAVVTITQVLRLMIIVISMPLLVMLPIFSNVSGDQVSTTTVDSVGMFPNIVFFALVCIVFAIGGNKIHFPTAYLLGPIIGTALLQLTGVAGPHLPAAVVDLAQLMIGSHVGLMLQTDQIVKKGWTFTLAIGSGILLMVGSILLSILLTVLHDVSHATALLSLAPGGMDQMGIIAHEINADLSMVSGYQLFRTFFIFFAIPPLLKVLFKAMERKNHQVSKDTK
ncbi:AbrB family transcriptional regulator [Ornithinibacillus bavariensis]|uniref:AbrB family transcriptional regulator n=1 Tax=Ornithinibacillus bavariensis TaxID=545502 RepID=UPI003D22D8FB